MSNRFYFGHSDDSGSDASDLDNDSSLPFPKPLDRSAFLVQDFDATAFLSTLSDRFQTLEDLKTELRELSQSLNKELVDLVNDNYQDFLSLGTTLAGGEERIEDIRVGLLGFQRDIQSVRDRVDARRNEVAALVTEKKAMRKDITAGRTLLDIAERLDELEVKLGLTQPFYQTIDASKTFENTGVESRSSVWHEEKALESDDDYEENEHSAMPSKLQRRTEEFLMIAVLIGRFSPHHPFLLAEQTRTRRIRENLLLDIDLAIKAASDVKAKQTMLKLREQVDE